MQTKSIKQQKHNMLSLYDAEQFIEKYNFRGFVAYYDRNDKNENKKIIYTYLSISFPEKTIKIHTFKENHKRYVEKILLDEKVIDDIQELKQILEPPKKKKYHVRKKFSKTEHNNNNSGNNHNTIPNND